MTFQPSPNKFCCLCNKPAMYTANFKGYCAGHKIEAQRAMQEVNRLQETRNWRSLRKRKRT